MFKNTNTKTLKPANFIRFFTAFAALVALSACIKNTELIGYTFKSEKLDQIKIGQTSQSYVRNTLGSPSVISTYGKNTWFYISSEYETLAFLQPKVKNQMIIAITFNENDQVADIKEYSAEDANDIEIASDLTKTEGRNVGVIGQLLGNVGRFNSAPGGSKIQKPRSAP